MGPKYEKKSMDHWDSQSHRVIRFFVMFELVREAGNSTRDVTGAFSCEGSTAHRLQYAHRVDQAVAVSWAQIQRQNPTTVESVGYCKFK